MKKFWSTKDAGQKPFTYQAGVGGVIKGWDQGCLGMQIGEVRSRGSPPMRVMAQGFGVGHPPGRHLALRDRDPQDRGQGR